MANKVRNNVISDLMNDVANTENIIRESAKGTMSNLLDESVARALRGIIKENADVYQEEDVDAGSEGADDAAVTDREEEKGAAEEAGAEDTGAEDDVPGDGEEEDGSDEGFEDVVDSDGDYDLRGKSIEEIIDFIQNLDPDTPVKVVKDSDGENGGEETFSAAVEDDEAEEGFGGDDMPGDEDAEDAEGADAEEEGGEGADDYEFEISFGDEDGQGFEDAEDAEDGEPFDDDMNEGKVNLGYTDDYQDRTAMTMPGDKDDGRSIFDGGAPKGQANNGKRWVGTNGKNGGNPYTKRTQSQPVDEMNEGGEECIFEVEMDECGANECGIREGSRTHGDNRHMHKSMKTPGSKRAERGHVRSEEGSYKGSEQNESVKRQMKQIMNENRQLRGIASELYNKLGDTAVVTSSLAKITKLFLENSTTRDEKVSIFNRFNNVTRLDECEELYRKISKELKDAHPINESITKEKISESISHAGGSSIVEKSMLTESTAISQMKNLMGRMGMNVD